MADRKQPTLIDAPPDAGIPLDPEPEPEQPVVDAEIVEPPATLPAAAAVGLETGGLVKATATVTGGDLDTARRLAEGLARTEFAPKSMRNNAGAVMAAILTGREIGLGPMASLQNISIIDGRPNLSAKVQLALVRRAGHRVEGTADATRAELVGTRADTGETMTVVWSLEDAARAGLTSIDEQGRSRRRSSSGKPMPWESYTPAMLWARAATELCSRLFSDVVTFGTDPDLGADE